MAQSASPFAKWKAQKPADIPQQWWDQYWGEKEAKYASDANYRNGVDQQLRNPNEAAIMGEAQQRWDAVPYAKKQELAAKTQSSEQTAGLLQQILGDAQATRTDNNRFVDENVVPNLQAQKVAGALASAGDVQALEGLKQSGNTYANDYDKFAGTAQQNTTRSNDAAQQLFDQLNGTYSDLNASDRAGLTDYKSETTPLMKQLEAQGIDPEGLGAQRTALGQATGIADGAFNYDAATYQSNAGDVARQGASYDDLRGAGYGDLDYASQAARAFADPNDVAAQKAALGAITNDRINGGKDQREILDLAKSRTGVEQTAQERLLYELNRRQAEAQGKSSRDAVDESLAARGLRSGGAQIARLQQSGQQTSQDRVLGDMIANAAAVGRAKDYTQIAGTAANSLRGSDQQSMGLESQLSTALRNAGFDESYKRGVGADTASSNNQSTRLGGITAAGGLATAMRNASDNVGLTNAGYKNQASANNQSTQLGGAQLQGNMANQIRSANDTIRMFQDTYAQNEAARVGKLAGDRLTATTNTNQGIGNRASDLNTQGQTMVNNNYGRDTDALGALATAADKQYSTDTDYYKNFADVGQRNFERAGAITNTSSNIAGVRGNTANSGSNSVSSALMTLLGQGSVDEAKRLFGA